MKRKIDYASLLEKQCAVALLPTSSGVADSERCYVQMCKMLISDFLPPIAREDIAALSYAFLDLSQKALDCGTQNSAIGNELTAVIELAGKAATACVKKEKVCSKMTADLEKAYLRCNETVNAFCNRELKTGNGERILSAERARRLCDSAGEAVCLIRSAMLRSL